MTINLETLTDKLIAGEITREEFLAEQKRQTEAEAKRLAEAESKERDSRKTYTDAGAYVSDQLQTSRDNPNIHVFVDLLGLFVKKVEDQTGYIADTNAFNDFHVNTLEEVLQVMSVLRHKHITFPTMNASRTKFTYGDDKKVLPINKYIIEYLFNETKEADEFITEEDF